MFRKNYYFKGQVIAETQLAVNRPNDNFRSRTGSDKMQRLPRLGPKKDDTPVFIPGDTFRGTLRRCGEDFLRRKISKLTNDSKPFSIDDRYMLRQGVDTRNLVIHEKTDGLISSEDDIRISNPFLSLFGRWRLAGHLGVGNLFPVSDDVVFLNSKGARINDYIRSPEQIRFLTEEDAERVRVMALEDSKVSSARSDLEREMQKLLIQKRDSDSKDEKDGFSKKIDKLEKKISGLSDAKVGSKDAIQRPLEGHEALRPGTILDHKMVLNLANEYELGLFLQCLREFARIPFLGGQKRTSSGEVRCLYDVSCWDEDQDFPCLLGKIDLSIDGFYIHEEIEGSLKNSINVFSTALESNKFDFKKFLVET